MNLNPHKMMFGPISACIVATSIGMLAWSFLASDTDHRFAVKPVPADPAALEEIKQARGLTRLGKLEDAAEILERHAQQDHPLAIYYLARAYRNGWGVPADLGGSRDLYLRAVQYDFEHRGQSAYELGRLYLLAEGEDCARIAREWFHKALTWQNTKAHFQLAKLYERGIGGPLDVDLALYHYEAAAESGYEAATIKFARVLRDGRYGVPKQPEKAQALADLAIDLLEQKAAMGSASAAKFLGRLHRDGDFVPPSYDRAEYWLEAAANLSDAGAMHDLARLLLSRIPDDEAAPQAIGWLMRAGEAAHGGALTTLGRLHLKEKHDLKKNDAFPWFEKGVAAKHGGAMEELARLYADGVLVPQDFSKAHDLARKGAALGHKGSTALLEQLAKAHTSGSDQI